MTDLAQHVSFGSSEQIWLSMPTCTASRADQRQRTWLRRLHPNGYRDVRALIGNSPAMNRSCRADDLVGFDKFVTSHVGNRNLYVGIATRDGHGRKTANCIALHVLFADIDYGKLPENDARRRLAAFPMPPSAVVASGGGL